MVLRIVGGALLAAMVWSSAMATPASPGGVYSIINATSAQAEQQQAGIAAESLQNPGVDGLLIHLRWNEVAPSRTQYKWAALDAAVQLAINANKRFEIGILVDGAIPDWVIAPAPGGLGAQSATFSYDAAMANGCNTIVIAAPYDPAYLMAFRELIQHLAQHLRGTGVYAKLSMLKLVGINTTTDELRLPALAQCKANAVQTWQTLGYTPAKLRGAWDTMLKIYLAHFPDKAFNIGFIGINAFPGIEPDGSAAKTPLRAAALSQQLAATLIADAGKAMPGRLALGFDSLTLNPTQLSYQTYLQAFFAAAQGANAWLGWQTNELLGGYPRGGAACGGSTPAKAIPCASSADFRALLFRGIYPLGKTKTPPDMQGVYLELFPQNIILYPAAVRAAHNNLAQWKN
jgi:hypothetical protein